MAIPEHARKLPFEPVPITPRKLPPRPEWPVNEPPPPTPRVAVVSVAKRAARKRPNGSPLPALSMAALGLAAAVVGFALCDRPLHGLQMVEFALAMILVLIVLVLLVFPFWLTKLQWLTLPLFSFFCLVSASYFAWRSHGVVARQRQIEEQSKELSPPQS
jgi:hypothetical protein